MSTLRALTACAALGLLVLVVPGALWADAFPALTYPADVQCCVAQVSLLEPTSPGESSRRSQVPSEPVGSPADMALKPIQTTVISLVPPPGPALPADAAGRLFQEAGQEFQPTGYSRPWAESLYAWTAPALAYRPLYFEDLNLERYGYHYGMLQPAVSAGCFFGRLPAIPYMCGARPCRECSYTLGYDRPGDCVPHFFSRPRLSLRGALYEGAAATGLVFLLP